MHLKDLIKSFSNYELRCLVESISRYIEENSEEYTKLNSLLTLLENELKCRNLEDK